MDNKKCREINHKLKICSPKIKINDKELMI